jgi:integrase/recombinase XerD
MSESTVLLLFQPTTMSTAQFAAVSYLARYAAHTHHLYAYQMKRCFAWCESNGLDPLVGIQRAHVELYIRQLGDSGLMDSTVTTMMHGVRGFFRFAHIDGLSPPTRRSTPGFPRSTATSPGPRDWTASN